LKSRFDGCIVQAPIEDWRGQMKLFAVPALGLALLVAAAPALAAKPKPSPHQANKKCGVYVTYRC
jgi:hypothetical protein